MIPFTAEEVLDRVPQRPPFRFIEKILAMDEKHIVSEYTFKTDEFFYPGHFPGNPITPGVVLLETLAQTGVVAHGLYLASLQMPRDEIARMLTVFTEANVEFTGMVKPGDKVEIRSEKVFFRHLKMKSAGEIRLADGRVVLQATIAGMGVKTS